MNLMQTIQQDIEQLEQDIRHLKQERTIMRGWFELLNALRRKDKDNIDFKQQVTAYCLELLSIKSKIEIKENELYDKKEIENDLKFYKCDCIIIHDFKL